MDPLFYNAITIGSWAIVIILLLILIRIANVFRYIPNNQVGIVEKMWAPKGSITSGFIALHGEAGFEPEILRGGIHVFWPFTYRIHKSDLVTVGQGRIADVSLVGSIEEDKGLMPPRVFNPGGQLCAGGHGARGIVRKAEIDDVHDFRRRLGNEAILGRAAQVGESAV